ncbi:NADP-dependent oxidoreductase [Longispora albida]|uniref:NADP-dependent oxidoreductase n=1 Tax=Longispora albida TaxID=203523 RepID=UPI000371AF65|nr:NADP-dependent oxidoreductase [Longispora albida]
MARYVHQIARPHGRPTADQFRFVDAPDPVPGPGQALVENLYLSVDPYMREVMNDGDLDAPMEGRALGRVLSSDEPGLSEGDLILHRDGWRTHAVVGAGQYRKLRHHDGVPLDTFLGLLGGTGLSAYVGLTRIGRIEAGETVFISAAAGGVGSAAGQIARLLGAKRIIGSAGSDTKAEYLTSRLGFDAAINYRAGNLRDQLAQAAPDGIDLYFDNVGGEHMEAAIDVLKPGGRIVWCGAVSQYNNTGTWSGPANLYEVVYKTLRLEGFLVREHMDAQPELEDFLVPHLRSGAVHSAQTIVDGFDGIVDAFLDMLSGANTGKMIVRL